MKCMKIGVCSPCSCSLVPEDGKFCSFSNAFGLALSFLPSGLENNLFFLKNFTRPMSLVCYMMLVHHCTT